MKLLIDASSIIHGWDNYPIDVPLFDSLWAWLKEVEITSGNVGIVKENLEEVKQISPDCFSWLKDANIQVLTANNETLQKATFIATEILQVRNDQYSKKGCDYNDLLLIATASVEKLPIISDEGDQAVDSIRKNKNYKIPLVCRLLDPPIKRFAFVDFIKHQHNNKRT